MNPYSLIDLIRNRINPVPMRRLFSKYSFGRRTRQRPALSTGNRTTDMYYITAADEKRNRKLSRGPGFSKPAYEGYGEEMD